MTFEITVDAISAGKRLDVFLAESEHKVSRSQAKILIEEGRVAINGTIATKAGLNVQAGWIITLDVPKPQKLELVPHDLGIKIIYEDDHVAVLEKPAGISVHPSETEQGPTVVHGLLHALKSLSSIGGVERPGIVHRIDKGTSGILVVTKTDIAHLGLSRQFKEHSIDRRYQAMVYGDIKTKLGKDRGRIETLIGRSPTHRKKMTTKLDRGRKAITNWFLTESLVPTAKKAGCALSLVECRLETGRTHQIRVHLSELGFPLVGDPLYGDHERRARVLEKSHSELGNACLLLKRQFLHAYHLGFQHPVTNESLSFQSPLPDDLASILKLARSA